MLTQIPTLDAILSRHASLLGQGFEPYRNHAYRVTNLCAWQGPREPERIEKMGFR